MTAALKPEKCFNIFDPILCRNNRITRLEAHTFKGCPKLRELSLSFNNLKTLDDLSFTDVGSSLESLEISFGLQMRVFPESALKPLQKLLWLSLDNNQIEEISETSLYSLGELQYLNLEANKLAQIPANLLHKNVHKNLRDVRMSFNKLTVVRSSQFNSLDKLQTVVLTGKKPILLNILKLTQYCLVKGTWSRISRAERSGISPTWWLWFCPTTRSVRSRAGHSPASLTCRSWSCSTTLSATSLSQCSTTALSTRTLLSSSTWVTMFCDTCSPVRMVTLCTSLLWSSSWTCPTTSYLVFQNSSWTWCPWAWDPWI